MSNPESKPWDNWSAPTGVWGSDVMGPGFVAQTMPLADDDQGPVVATLVRHDPELDPKTLPGTPVNPSFAVLYIHGWNDYFFQAELAREVARCGGRFYGIDLRKYGRSLRDHQTFGYITDLRQYDEDLQAALNLIAKDGRLPLVLMGHSTGGLTAALWAHRHPGVLAGLMLNSPWLELQTSPSVRETMRPIVERVAARSPQKVLSLDSGPNFYGMSLTGWLESDGPVPPELAQWPDDPSVKGGWNLNPKWKNPQGAATRAAWLYAILRGHQQVAQGLDIDCPIFVGTATSSGGGKVWDPIMRRQDVVLDVAIIAQRAIGLGRRLQLFRYDSKHDLVLSDPDVRILFYTDLGRWFEQIIRSDDGQVLVNAPRQAALAP